MAPYDPARRPVALDLSANTSLRGPAPAAVRVLAEAGEEAGGVVARYPTPYADTLKAALAGLWGVEPGNVVTGCGSDDLIDSAIRAFCEPGATVAFPAPTFPMAELFARMNDARRLAIRAGPSGELDDEAIARLTAADVVYICRPNNPTGSAIGRETVRTILDRARGLVLVDEAYGEYSGDTLLHDVLGSGRGVVLRTLSKAYGLAGLRVGYAVGTAAIVRAIELSRGPYKVGALAEAAAVAAVADQAWLEESVAETLEGRDRLADRLRERGLRPLPSSANFLLVPVPDALALKAALERRGVGVRAFPDLDGVGSVVRVTAGPWPAMERLLAALDEAREEVGP